VQEQIGLTVRLTCCEDKPLDTQGVVRHQRCRRAYFHGLAKVLTQAVLTALVVNVKRMVKLLAHPPKAATAALVVRAELCVT
jgi:hypothetical protein